MSSRSSYNRYHNGRSRSRSRSRSPSDWKDRSRHSRGYSRSRSRSPKSPERNRRYSWRSQSRSPTRKQYSRSPERNHREESWQSRSRSPSRKQYSRSPHRTWDRDITSSGQQQRYVEGAISGSSRESQQVIADNERVGQSTRPLMRVPVGPPESGPSKIGPNPTLTWDKPMPAGSETMGLIPNSARIKKKKKKKKGGGTQWMRNYYEPQKTVTSEAVWKIQKVVNCRDMDARLDDVNPHGFARRCSPPPENPFSLSLNDVKPWPTTAGAEDSSTIFSSINSKPLVDIPFAANDLGIPALIKPESELREKPCVESSPVREPEASSLGFSLMSKCEPRESPIPSPDIALVEEDKYLYGDDGDEDNKATLLGDSVSDHDEAQKELMGSELQESKGAEQSFRSIGINQARLEAFFKTFG